MKRRPIISESTIEIIQSDESRFGKLSREQAINVLLLGINLAAEYAEEYKIDSGDIVDELYTDSIG